MTENIETTSVPESFDLLAWIDTGTIATREVTLFIDHEAAVEYADIQKQLAVLQAEADAVLAEDGPMTYTPPHADEIADLEAQAEVLQGRLDAAKAVWTVRAISHDELKQVFNSIKYPKAPVPPKDGAAKPLVEAFYDKSEAYGLAKMEVDEARKVALVATAVTSVVTGVGVRDSVTAEELQLLKKRPHGQQWLDMLWAAVESASDSKVTPPVF